MRINATAKARASGPVRSKRSGQAESPFVPAQQTAGKAANAGALSGASPLVSVESLIALQEGDDFRRARKAARQRADELLDILDAMRLGLLEGGISRTLVQRLSGTLARARAGSGDMRLEAVLNEVEVRAAVEMAKLESST